MAINSIEYIIFISIILLFYYIIPKSKRWILLLISSYIFYFLSSKKLTIFLIITTLSIYFIGRALNKSDEICKKKCNEIEKTERKLIKEKYKKKKKICILIGVLINVGILVGLKYTNFISQNINYLATFLNIKANIKLVNIILPLGISYYTLQAISYIVDVYRGKYKSDKHLGRLALFLVFFPQIVEGPIGRYDKLANQLYESKKFDVNNLKYGVQLLIWGYFKKMVIADRAGLYVNSIFNNYTNYSGLLIILAIMLYTLQIYAEFSGCMDIVRGVAKTFGIDLEENFKRPFFSKSIKEFWRRWHITLGAWLKEYVFYPISLSKISIKINNFSSKHIKNYFNKIIPVAFSLFFVWFINGLWHGANWKYIVYGLYYYIIMIIGMIFEPVSKKIIDVLKINVKSRIYSIFQIIRTTVLVCIGMLIFRSESLKMAFQMLKSVIGYKDIDKFFTIGWQVGDGVIILISVIILFIIGILQEKGHSIRAELSKKNIAIRWLLYYGIIFSILIFGIYGQGYNPSSFIYGQF